MKEQTRPVLTFLDKFLNVPEAKVTYLTKETAVDRFLARTFLKCLPTSITPNHITKFRIITIPFIAILLALDLYVLGGVLFVFSAFSDALDGALARTGHKVTTWGTLYDPIADKLLIGMVSIIVVSKYISLYTALIIICIEILLVSSAYFRYKGRVVPAKTMGKTKMILQCVGVILLFGFIFFNIPLLLTLATYVLYVSILFGLLSLFVFRSI